MIILFPFHDLICRPYKCNLIQTNVCKGVEVQQGQYYAHLLSRHKTPGIKGRSITYTQRFGAFGIANANAQNYLKKGGYEI